MKSDSTFSRRYLAVKQYGRFDFEEHNVTFSGVGNGDIS
jgi:hypothetical protein